MSVVFPATWCATDLGDHRPCARTYERYPYESLPPLDEAWFTGSFGWFGDLGTVVPERAAEMEASAQALSERGITLPQDFVTFQTRCDLMYALDEVSVTACWSDISQPMESPVEPGAYLVRFLRDQQDCVLWYLYLRPSGAAFVVHSYELAQYLDHVESPEGRDDGDEPYELDIDSLIGEIFWCAPTFEQFAYRFWIENRIWGALHDQDQVLGEAERRYLDHYRVALH